MGIRTRPSTLEPPLSNSILLTVLLAVSMVDVEASPCASVQANDELIVCLGNEFASVDAKLNRRYSILRKTMSKDQQDLLRKAQVSWLVVRDSDCELQASWVTGGQAYEPTFLVCQTDKTRQRILELDRLGG